jgi:hypothetical protein
LSLVILEEEEDLGMASAPVTMAAGVAAFSADAEELAADKAYDSGENKRDLFFCGFERERGTLKYRCPAAAYDLNCKGRTLCEAMEDVGSFGRTVRVPLDLDRRIFTPVAHPTAKWKRAYARRTAVERVNSRIDLVLGFERHHIRGLDKMRCRISFALVIMLAMALGRIRKNQADLMRSMTAPVKRVA